MTAALAIRAAAERLAATSDTARLDAELLMAHAFGVSRSDLLLSYMGHEAPQRYFDFVERRAAHEPLAYITGEQEFFGRTFAVNKHTLIPRSDSEQVVEAALEACPKAKRVLDLGTGTGALLITLVLELDAEGVGIDRSVDAIGVADVNANRLGAWSKVTVQSGDWTKPGWKKRLGTFDLIIANPPYVESTAQLDASVQDYEPHGALFSGPDGLDDYRVLIPQLASLLSPNGTIVLEIGYQQGGSVAAIAKENGYETTLKYDLAGRPRAMILRRDIPLGVGKAGIRG